MTLANQQSLYENSFTANGLESIRNDITLFSGLNFRLNSGEILQVQGPNGSGKTSLIRILCGLVLADKGDIFWNEKNIHENRHEFLKETTYIGHINGIKTELTPIENINITRALAVANNVSAIDALEKVDLAEYENIPAQKLSSGQRRRLALTRLLITQAKLWILDEPLTSLDDAGKQLVKNMIAGHAASGGITVLSTHEPVDIDQIKMIKINL